MDSPKADLTKSFVFVVVVVAFILVILSIYNTTNTESENQAKALTAVPANLIPGTRLYEGSLIRSLSPSAIGQKRALLFGLNYRGTKNQLNGCIQDVQNVQRYLQTMQFQCNTFTDDTSLRPTYSNILSEIQKFLQTLSPGDIGILWYSGHGSFANGKNAIVPLDFSTRGFIYEDQLRSFMQRCPSGVSIFCGIDACYSGTFFDLKYDLEPNGSIVRITKSFDSVGLSTKDAVFPSKDMERNHELESLDAVDVSVVERALARNAYAIQMFQHTNYKGRVSRTVGVGRYTLNDFRNLNIVNNTVSSILVPKGLRVTLYDGNAINGTSKVIVGNCPNLHLLGFGDKMSSFTVEFDTISESQTTLANAQKYSLFDVRATIKAMDSYVVYLSSCRDNQVAYDAYLEGLSQGAMTWSFLKALRTMQTRSGTPKTFGFLQDLMREILMGAKFPQVPQTSFGSPMDPFIQLQEWNLL